MCCHCSHQKALSGIVKLFLFLVPRRPERLNQKWLVTLAIQGFLGISREEYVQEDKTELFHIKNSIIGVTWVSNPSSFSSSHCLGKRWTLSYLRDKTLASQMDRNPFLLMPTAIIIHKDSGRKELGVDLSLFWHMAFWKETFQQKRFGTIDILAYVPFVPMDVPALGHCTEIS